MMLDLLAGWGMAMDFGQACSAGQPWIVFLAAGLAALGLAAVVGTGAEDRRVHAGLHRNLEGTPKAFTLTLGKETVTLDPGKSWIKADVYKWVTRGLIEPPQSFHVAADAAVEINGQHVALDDPEGTAKLEAEINKHHEAPAPRKAAATAPIADPVAKAALTSNQVQLRVKLDHLGHLMIEAFRRTEHYETGLRGLGSLVQNGLLLKPQAIHFDPLQRYVELDGIRFEANPEGAGKLEEYLNARYAPLLKDEGEHAVDIRENPASSTGFDISFVTIHSGARLEVKGHLSQEKLDFLQDPAKCDLIRSGIVLRLSPPNLLIRRRRPDGGEEPIPELPDVSYRRVNAAALQQILNHPLVRRTGAGGPHGPGGAAEDDEPADIVAMRLVRQPENKMVLWLECATVRDGAVEGRAFTHHNVAELQQQGVFRSGLDVTLSLDHRTLGVLDTTTAQETTLSVGPESPDEALAQASRLLTDALRPPRPYVPKKRAAPGPLEPSPPASLPPPATPPPAVTRANDSPPGGLAPPSSTTLGQAPISPLASQANPPEAPGSSETQLPTATRPSASTPSSVPLPATPVATRESLAAPASDEETPPALPPTADSSWASLFSHIDPWHIHTEVFQRLASLLGVRVQQAFLTLPRVFEDRRFEIISFYHPEVRTILDLRSAEFYGFYLSHVDPKHIIFVYACQGRHVEWGPDRCLLQPAVTEEAEEFRGSALLGMALTRENHFVFVVRQAYKDWAKNREKHYNKAFAHFVTPEQLAATPDAYILIWPVLA